MSEDLASKKCVPCEGGIPNFDITEIHKYLKMVDGWEVKSDENKIYYLNGGSIPYIYFMRHCGFEKLCVII